MSNAWNKLKMSVKITEDTFNDTVGGSSYLGRGRHSNVFIEGCEAVELKGADGTEHPALKLVWSNEGKQSIRQTVFVFDKDENGDVVYGYGLKNLLQGLISDKLLRGKFMEMALDNPGLFASFVGLRADIEVREGRKGYSAKQSETGGVILYDVKEKKQIGDTTYESYADANAAGKNMGLKRAYDEVGFVNPAKDKEFREKNDAAIRSVVETKPGTTGGSTTGVRPVALRSSL